jgi:MoaA/NifB/PqqE/SkfB family radical SAM enzyme
MVDLRGRGESTILHSFPVYLKKTLSTGVRVRLVTNASAMKQHLWEELFLRGNNEVNVSFDSADPAIYNEIGRGNYDQAVRGLKLGAETLRRGGVGKLSIIAVVSARTLEDLPALIQFAADVGVPQVSLNPLMGPKNIPGHLDNVRKRIPAVLDEAKKVAERCGVVLHLIRTLDPDLAILPALANVCSKPWSHVLIDHTGEVVFCDCLESDGTSPGAGAGMGSLHNSDFESIWNGERYQRVRAWHAVMDNWIGDCRYRKLRKLRSALEDGDRQAGGEFGICAWCYPVTYRETGDISDRPEVSTTGTGELYHLN